MKCDRATELIAQSIVDAADPTTRAALQRHIDACPSCRVEAERYASLWEDVALAAAPTPDPNGRERFEEALRQYEGGGTVQPAHGSGGSMGRWALRVAAALVFVVGGMAGGIVLERSSDGGGAPTVRDEGRFLLLVRGVGTAIAADSTLEDAFSDWAQRLGVDGQAVREEAVEEGTGVWVGTPTNPYGPNPKYSLSGYLVIRARDLNEATGIAGAAPHLAANGSIEVWPIR